MLQNVLGTAVVVSPIVGGDISPTAAIPPSAQAFCGSFGTNWGAVIGALPSTREEYVYVANNAGVITGFHAEVQTPGGTTALVTVDCKVNGTSITGSSPISITNSSAAATILNGTGTPYTYAAGAMISLSFTNTTPGSMVGVRGWVNIAERAQPL